MNVVIEGPDVIPLLAGDKDDIRVCLASLRAPRALIQAQDLLFRSILDSKAVQVSVQVTLAHPVKDDVNHACALIVLGPAP